MSELVAGAVNGSWPAATAICFISVSCAAGVYSIMHFLSEIAKA